jgi:hypothetical protein
MDFDLGWILLGLPLAFVLGWLSSRFDIRQLKLENRQNPKAYFKGLNHLLNEQQVKTKQPKAGGPLVLKIFHTSQTKYLLSFLI